MTDPNINTDQARKFVRQIEQKKRASLRGGGKDFRGSLKRLVGIWNNPSHALTELLQNADDAGSTAVEYKVLPKGILLFHNGKPFTKREVRALCSVDDSTKDAEKHTGFMGIGFKAVFKLSDSPCIVCPPWRFRFSPDGFSPDDWGWILIPRWIDHPPSEISDASLGKTAFWLPYKNDLSEDAIHRIEHEIFESFDSLCLMFLRNIGEIGIEIGNGSIRKLTREKDTVIEEKNGKETRRQFKIFRRLFPVDDKVKEEYAVRDSGREKAKVREIVLAFSLDSKGNLQPMTDSLLYTFLPTDYSPGLRFAVQGDFILDTQRSSVDESLKWNQWLWRSVKDLLRCSIEGFTRDDGNYVQGFKEHAEMRYHFYHVLPLKEDFAATRDQSILFTELIGPFWDYCRENSIIITSCDIWVKPSEAVLTSLEVQELLDGTKLKELTGREYFVHPNVEGVKGFLNEIGVADFPEQNLLEGLKDEAWLHSKEIAWFRKLYNFLLNRLTDHRRWQTGWWRQEDLVKGLAIVRTTNGIVKKPDEVLFPPENEKELEFSNGIPGIFFVESLLLEDNSRRLLEKLGVQTFSTESVVKTFIIMGFEDGTWKKWTEEQLCKSVLFIKEWLRNREWKSPGDLLRKLGAVRVRTEANRLERGDNCYFDEEGLKLLYPEANFVGLHKEDDDEVNFLSLLGVKDRPRVLFDHDQHDRSDRPSFALRWSDYWSWLSKIANLPSYSRGIRGISYIESWDKIYWSPKLGETMLDYLVDHWEDDYQPHVKSSYVYLPYRCQYSREEKIPSYLHYQLLETKWLPTTHGLMKPSPSIFVPLPKISKVVGNLVPYVIVPLGWKDQDFLSQGQKLFRFLGLRDEFDIDSLMDLLRAIQKHPIDEDLKPYLSNIYQILGRLIEDEGDRELVSINLLTESSTFEKSTSLYWNDDRDLGSHFQKIEGAHFAWVPDGVERRYIEIFFQKVGVKKLSKNVHRKLVTPTIVEPNKEWPTLLQEKARYIYSLLKHHNAEHAEISREKLGKVQVLDSSEKLEVLLILDDLEITVNSDVLYEIDSNVFYLCKQVDNFEIAMELARLFGLDFSHISDIEIIFHEKSNRIEERYQRQGIALLNLDQSALPSINKIKPEEKDERVTTQTGQTTPGRSQTSHTSDSSTSGSEQGDTSSSAQKSPRRDATGRQVQRVPLPYDERMEEEASNIERIIKFEEIHGRKANDVSKEYKGYDLESVEDATGEVRYIEVKTPGFVLLTPHEYKIAKERGGSYYLYVTDADAVYITRNPAGLCEIIGIETLETRWKILDWEGNSEKFEL